MPTYRIDLGYDGSGFHGYARNPGVRTVQGSLEDALERTTGAAIETTVAGRTDAGVHARGQVVSFDADAVDVDGLARSLRSMLGPEIAIHRVVVAPDGFHARFSAVARRYRYRIDDGPTPDPLRRSHVWHVEWPLDVEAMDRAAAYFVGDHDFASLCRSRAGKTTQRTVFSAGWTRSGLIEYDVEGRAFCHQMVRSMVALCVDVGRGKVATGDVPEILAAKDRNSARGAAPPHGLMLMEVSYPESF